MRKTNYLKSLLIAVALLMGGSSAWADEGSATVKMTYINGSDANVDTSYGEVETAYCGYNKISSGKVELSNKDWGVNNIAYLQVDASNIDGTITGATLTVDCQQITARGLNYGVGYNTAEWSSELTWNTADRSITTMGDVVNGSKTSADKNITFDISAALVGDEDKIATILVYQTAAGGGYVKNPVVTIKYRPTAQTVTTTTSYNFEGDEAVNPFKIADAARMTSSIIADETLQSKVLKHSCSNMNVVAFSYYNFSELVQKAVKVDIEFDFYVPEVAGHELISIADADYHTLSGAGFTEKSNTGYGSKGSIFNLGCYRGGGNNKFAVNNKQNDLAGLNSWCHAKVVIDVANKLVDYVITDLTGEELMSATGQNYLNSDAQKCTQIDFYIGTNTSGNCINLDNLFITSYVNVGGSYADYTVVSFDETSGQEIRSETRNDEVGSAITLEKNDKDAIFNDDETVRYIYVSDDAAEKEIAEDGSTIVTITFRQAEKWNYTIGTIYGETKLSFESEGWVWEDLNNISVVYPRFQALGRQLLEKAPVSNELKQSVTISMNNDHKDLSYSAVEGVDNLYLLAEAENLGTSYPTSPTSFSARVSGNKIIYAASGALITLPAGKYKFTLGVVGKPNNGTCIYNVNAGDNVIITELASGGNYLTLGTSDEFELSTPTPISFTCSNANSDRGIDLIYIQKTDKMPEKEEVNVTAAGYATLASNYALDLSEMENIYTANIADGIVNFSQNNGKVLPGTGLLIKAPQGKVEIPIISEAATVTDNALVGVLADTKLDAGIFVLMNGDEGVGFYKATNEAGFTVRANSAYLPASVAGARFIGLDATATGISDTTRLTDNETVNKELYNLQGQRVAGAQPKKGLYIQEGRKVIIK